MEKSRKFNIVAGVFDILLAATFVVLTFMMLLSGTILVSFFGALGGSGESAAVQLATSGSDISTNISNGLAAVTAIIVIMVALIFAAGFAIYLAFGIVTLKKRNADDNKYYESRKSMLAFSIIETILVGAAVYLTISTLGSALSITLLALSTFAALFHWLGYGFAKRPQVVQTVEATTVELVQEVPTVEVVEDVETTPEVVEVETTEE